MSSKLTYEVNFWTLDIYRKSLNGLKFSSQLSFINVNATKGSNLLNQKVPKITDSSHILGIFEFSDIKICGNDSMFTKLVKHCNNATKFMEFFASISYCHFLVIGQFGVKRHQEKRYF